MGVLKVWDGTDWRKVGCGGGPPQTVFSYTGADQSFVVPAGMTSLTLDLYGGEGGVPADVGTKTKSKGGHLKATIAVTPGETLTLIVGQAGRPGASGGVSGDAWGGSGTVVDGRQGFKGGGSGGAGSAILRGSTVLAAAGGGGGCGGNATSTVSGLYLNAGGLGGDGGGTNGSAAGAPSLAAGGVAGASTLGSRGGTISTASTFYGGGGGGGGWAGGSSGALAGTSSNEYQGGGGGGGTNGTSGTVVVSENGVRSGNGEIALAYSATDLPGRLRLWTGSGWVREACDDDLVVGITDNFDRADGSSVLLNRSDGRLWQGGSTQEILSNRLIRIGNGFSTPPIGWLYADYGYDETVSVSCDYNFPFADGAIHWWIATDPSASDAIMVLFDANFGRLAVERGGVTLATAAVSGYGLHTITIDYDYGTGALDVGLDGTSYITLTITGLTGTFLALRSSRDYATFQAYYDNLVVTGTGLLFSDDFNRADGPVGNGWTVVMGDPEIASNILTNGSPGTEMILVRDLGQSDVDITAEFTDSEPGAGIILRYQDASNYLFWAIGWGSGSFYEVVGGVFTSLGSVSSGGPGLYRILITGTTVYLWEDGAAHSPFTTSVHATQTRFGLRGETSLVSSFKVNDLRVAPVVAPVVHSLKLRLASGGDLLFTDDFARADGALGSGWLAAGWLIDTAAATPTAGGGFALHDVGVQYVDATWHFNTMTNDDRFYIASSFDGSYGVEISRFDWAKMDPAGNTSHGWGGGATIPTTATKLRVVLPPQAGGLEVIEVYVDDVLFYSSGAHGIAPDPAHSYCGFWSGTYVDTTLLVEEISVTSIEDVWTTVACMVPG